MNSDKAQHKRSRLKREILAVVGGVMVAGCAALVAMPRTHGAAVTKPPMVEQSDAAQASAGGVERTEANSASPTRADIQQPVDPDNRAMIINAAPVEPAQAVLVPVTLPGSGDGVNTLATGERLVLGRNIVMSYFVTMKSPPSCPADVDESGAIDGDDLEQFIVDYYAAEPSTKADFDHDGRFTTDDVAAYVQAFFGGCEADEPAVQNMELLRCENGEETQLMLTSFIAARVEAELQLEPQIHTFVEPLAGAEVMGR